MKSYELLGQEGIGSGVWACGECHKPHLIATKANRPVSDMNRKSAEECCAPRHCSYCGQITEREYNGQFRWAHDACVPKYEPKPRHPSMANPYARLLHKKMSDISEDFWFAGWTSGNEYALWKILHGDHNDNASGGIAYEDLEELRLLSEHANGWIWTGPEKEHAPQLVSFAEWESILAAGGHIGDDLVSELQGPEKGTD